MAIRPPSDIVLDVAKAADPLRYQEAVGRLSKIGGTTAADFQDAFGEVMRRPPPQRMPFDAATALTRLRNNSALSRSACGGPAASGPQMSAYRNFEAMALSSFVESMLPQRAEAVFGGGTAGQIWKSMLAEQVGAQLARSGGIGIAERMAAADPSTLRADKEEVPRTVEDLAAALSGAERPAAPPARVARLDTGVTAAAGLLPPATDAGGAGADEEPLL
jgi:flagellar protein FlgJ